MKFLFVSEAGDGVGLAYRVAEEGNDVVVWVQDDEALAYGDGMVDKVHDWKAEVDDDTIIVFDCTGAGFLADTLRKSGHRVVGSSALMDRLEMDRTYSQGVMEAVGISVPKAWDFADWEEAKKFLAEHDPATKFVFKPEGSNSGVIPSYVGADVEDLIEMLDHYAGKVKGEISIKLQEFIKGYEISTEVWSSCGALLPYNHTLETKHLMPGDVGPSGGCAGNLVWTDYNRIMAETVEKLEDFLFENEYIGCIDVNAIVTDEGEVFGLEFTPRFGYDATPTLLYSLLDGEIGKFFSDIASGQAKKELKFKEGFAAGIRVSVPPWPSERFDADPGLPVRGLKVNDWSDFYPYGISHDSDGVYRTAGTYGIVGIATGYAETIEKAFGKAYKLAEKLKLPNKQYRTDLKELFVKRYNELE